MLRDLPGGIRALGLGVQLVQAVDALERGAVYLSVQSPASTARGRREQQRSSSPAHDISVAIHHYIHVVTFKAFYGYTLLYNKTKLESL